MNADGTILRMFPREPGEETTVTALQFLALETDPATWWGGDDLLLYVDPDELVQDYVADQVVAGAELVRQDGDTVTVRTATGTVTATRYAKDSGMFLSLNEVRTGVYTK